MYLCTSATNSLATSQQFINHMTQMQGIVSILRSDNPEKTTKAASLRRTLSADMSSKRWLPTLKKIASSEHIAVDPSSYESNEEECDQVNEKSNGQNPSQMDIWTAIMSQKKQDESDKIPPPYVHPLVKKSASSLSEKSLKICTESLGSETGSDVFSPSSEKSGDDDQQEEKEKQKYKEEVKVVKSACLTTKKAQQAKARAFPPPLQSLAAARAEGPSLHMHSRRVDGRLVVDAVSVLQQKYFDAQRQDGRFLLTLIKDPKEEGQEQQQEEQKQPSDEDHDNNIIASNEKDVGILKSITPVINVHKLKRILGRDNENPSWSRKFNTGKIAKLEVVEEAAPIKEEIKESPPPRSRAAGLPPLPPAATTVNSYQYFWRAKPTVASVIDPMITQQQPPAKTKDLVLLRGNKADCFLPSLKGCKEPRRSLLMWEPFCIATS
ncbi:protein FAF-like, chloroplastic [Bidens hawaiensis]|uniref:protein FAF-like, chloroplastic n=1 Tax=Bidens hawaiensis TaxID=980011 RepID=UPI00404A0957